MTSSLTQSRKKLAQGAEMYVSISNEAQVRPSLASPTLTALAFELKKKKASTKRNTLCDSRQLN